MRTIHFQTIVKAVNDLCIQAAYHLPADVLSSLQKSVLTEQSSNGRKILEQCIENANLAVSQHLPICQDTGFAVFFVTMGSELTISGGTLIQAINCGVQKGYREGYLRNSIVNDPLFDRKNTGDNTPAAITLDIVAGDKLSITILPKGGGCENMSALAMLKPSEAKAGVMDFVVNSVTRAGGNPCPPVIVGVGIGGTADKVSCLAKKALLRPVGSSNPDPRYDSLEKEILDRINMCGNGPQGLGGTTTALAVHIETYPCHIASLPVAVNLNCHAARQATVII
ncbi:MAG TPA: fumarate hydratase [Chitinispirillaceae bacterium]|nr:fumarate hydratase [Chitinispirillaceae bacterium]